MNGDGSTAAGESQTPPFVPGLLLNERFYAEVVRPILGDAFPRLRYSAALIGYGSDVLGYDTIRSTDHEWGPRLLLFLDDADHPAHGETIRAILSQRLPPTFMGFSTHFGPPGLDGSRLPASSHGESIAHKIEAVSPRALLTSWLGVDPFGKITATDWLLMPQQMLLEVTAGRIYHDGLGVLGPIREKLAYYPHDVWLYLLAAQWQRISQHEAFVGRAGEMRDELGSAVVAAALVRDLMGLCFLLERRYAPYSKWFGTAFAELTRAPRLAPMLAQVLRAGSWREREAALATTYETVAGLHNTLAITAPVDPRTRSYHSRPFQVLHAERFADATLAAIADADVRAVINRAGLIGSVDQVSDSVDVVSHPQRVAKLRALYE